MKKIWGLAVMCLVLIGFVSLVCAQEEMEKSGMMGKAKMMGMAHMMMNKSIIATSDGGVVVMVGNKLYKYDKNLELKKEAQIKIDMEEMCKEMCKEMKEMKEKCRMKCEKMKEEGKVK